MPMLSVTVYDCIHMQSVYSQHIYAVCAPIYNAHAVCTPIYNAHSVSHSLQLYTHAVSGLTVNIYIRHQCTDSTMQSVHGM